MVREDPSRSRKALATAVMVRDVLQEDPSRSRRALATAVVVRDVMQEDPRGPGELYLQLSNTMSPKVNRKQGGKRFVSALNKAS